MVSKKRVLQRILGGTEKLVEMFEAEWQQEKDDETRALYNAVITVLVEHSATWQNTLAVLRMVEWSYIRAKYMENVEKSIIIPEGKIPIQKVKKKDDGRKLPK